MNFDKTHFCRKRYEWAFHWSQTRPDFASGVLGLHWKIINQLSWKDDFKIGIKTFISAPKSDVGANTYLNFSVVDFLLVLKTYVCLRIITEITGPYQTTNDLNLNSIWSWFPFVVTMQCMVSFSSAKRLDNYGCWSCSSSLYVVLLYLLIFSMSLSHSYCTVRFMSLSPDIYAVISTLYCTFLHYFFLH